MNHSSPRLCAGGTLGEGTLYVRRQADEELPAALLRGEFCYVLGPRQMGKSSLRMRTEAALQERGVRCVTVDLTLVGTTEVSPVQWCFTVAEEIADGLGLDVEAHWQRSGDGSPVGRLVRFLRDGVLREVPGPVVIFIDEIDAILAKPELSDDFFAAIRSMYNQRADDVAWGRLTFCLLGVAAPADLMSDPERTPFNIGRGIPLEDFTAREAEAFLPTLARFCEEPAAVLGVVLHFTDGHPYMTQRVCDALSKGARVAAGSEAARVAEVVEEKFLRRGRTEEPNLVVAERSFREDRRRTARRGAMVALYGRLLAGEVVVADSGPGQVALRLSGMAAERRRGRRILLCVRNRIFATVFDRAWLQEVEGDLPLNWIYNEENSELDNSGEVMSRRPREAVAEAPGPGPVVQKLRRWEVRVMGMAVIFSLLVFGLKPVLFGRQVLQLAPSTLPPAPPDAGETAPDMREAAPPDMKRAPDLLPPRQMEPPEARVRTARVLSPARRSQALRRPLRVPSEIQPAVEDVELKNSDVPIFR